MNPLRQLLEHGQSIWYDFISHDFIASGRMAELVEQGLRGMTSNPTIFEKAIAGGTSYDGKIQELSRAGKTTAEIATELFVGDVTAACDVMMPVYEQSGGADGFISLEVNPKLAHATDGTFEEAVALHERVNRPNLMVKIPATSEGLPAIRRCIAAGISINITLIFSVEQYRAVAEAFVAGLEDRLAAGHSIANVASVASVFVSRIDSMVDAQLDAIGTPEAAALKGRLGVANSKLVYQEFLAIFAGPRWERLAASGARVQRPLWASTSTKNPAYPELLYVDTLIGPNTVNTVPPETLEAIMRNISVRSTVQEGLAEAQATVQELAAIGININAVMATLLAEGLDKFVASFDALFEKLEAKRAALSASEA